MKFLQKGLLAICLLLIVGDAIAIDKTQLIGNWKGVSGSSIKIHFKKNMKYVYQYKMLTFSGDWTISNNDLTFHYSVLGSKRKKHANFSLRRGFLTLRSNVHSNVVLKKVR